MANDMMNTLRGLLGDNADEKIQSVLSALGGGGNTSSDSTPVVETSAQIVEDVPDNAPPQQAGNANPGNLNGDSLQYIMKIKSVIDEMGNANDSRSNLLLSLRPYMRTERQKGIDNAIKILNLSRIAGLFK